MTSDRLSLALEAGLLTLPDGPIRVWGARGTSDLSALPADRTTLVATFRPDHDALAAQGWEVTTEADGPCALGVVMLPRAKEAARAAIARAVAVTDGPVAIDGQKTDGVEGVLRDLRRRAALSEAISKAHGKIAVLAPGADLSDWADPGPRDVGGFVAPLGAFSADGPDRGSVLLAEALPERLAGRIADLGAGWGYLSRALLARDGPAEVHLVEAERTALDAARINVTDPRARFHWADALALGPDDLGGRLDAVVSNPPFHQGRRADPSLGQRFIAAAAGLLHPHGALWLVANRHLPYEGALAEAFREVAEIGGDGAFKVYRAARPARPARQARTPAAPATARRTVATRRTRA